MLELIQLDAAMILPAEIARAVAEMQAQTVANPYLALNHAIALDKQLADLGWDTPITYSAQGIAGLGWVLGETSPNAALKGALIDGHTQTQLGATQTGLATAFHSAHGVEIPALNLLYANQSVVIETLWLHFLNKYLAYFAPGANPHTYSLALTAPGQERFHRLRQKHTPAVEPAGPMISVLMPMYNAAATLNTAVASIRGQSWQNFELLLIDDCSQDNSLAIAQRLAEQDPRIKVIPLRTNGGPYIAKNIGLGFAKGDFITVHDADDWAFPTRFADQIRPLLNDATGTLKVSMGKTLRITASGQFTRFQPPNWVTNDGAMRWCFPSPLFERRYFVERLGAWDSVTVPF